MYSCQTYHTTWSSVDKKKIMSAFIGKAQEEYGKELQFVGAERAGSKPNFSGDLSC